jgi:hypothetical protein
MEKYAKQWSSAEPGLMIFLIDQSGSMNEPWEGGTRAEETAKAINNIVNNIVLKNMDGDAPKNRCYLSLIGYGSNGNDVTVINKGFLKEIADNYIRIEKMQKLDGIGGTLEVEMPIWLEPVSNGLTPMAGAFELAIDIIDKWLGKHPENPAPIVINISDGMAYNGNQSNEMEEAENTIKAFKNINNQKTSRDEAPLVFNVHIGGNNKKIGFPENESEIGDDDMGKFLFQISSVVPDAIKNNAKGLKFPIKDNSRAFIANADLIDLIQFIEFGSSQATGDKK